MIHKDLRNDKNLVLEAVKTHGAALEHAPNQFKADIEIAKVAIKQDVVASNFVDEKLKLNSEIVRLVNSKISDAIS